MANYYVSADRGNDASGAGTATSPWKTVDKAIGSGAAITLPGSGSTYLYIEPGVYREATTTTLAPSSSKPLYIIGDYDGAGFLAGGYSTPKTGLVDWRAWSDDLTPLTNPCLTINASPYTTVQRIKFLGGDSGTMSCLYVSGASTNVAILNCIFVGHLNRNTTGALIPFSAGAWNLTVDRCKFASGSGNALTFYVAYSATEYSINSVVRNCYYKGRGYGFMLDTSGGANSAVATGLAVQNNTFDYLAIAVRVYRVANVTMTTPISVKGNVFLNCGTGIQAFNTSQVDADYNALTCSTNLLNVNAGAHSLPLVAPAVDFGDAQISGLQPRIDGEPLLTSAYVGASGGGTTPSTDITGRPRPAGYGTLSPTCGAIERHDTARKETTTTDTGVGAAIVGPGDQILSYAVDANPTAPSVKVRYDANHGATTKPEVRLLSCPEIGVAAQTLTMTVAADTWETLTFSSFTPTGKGRVKIQFVPHPSAANGAMFMDTLV
jgi:hypothetical protein